MSLINLEKGVSGVLPADHGGGGGGDVGFPPGATYTTLAPIWRWTFSAVPVEGSYLINIYNGPDQQINWDDDENTVTSKIRQINSTYSLITSTGSPTTSPIDMKMIQQTDSTPIHIWNQWQDQMIQQDLIADAGSIDIDYLASGTPVTLNWDDDAATITTKLRSLHPSLASIEALSAFADTNVVIRMISVYIPDLFTYSNNTLESSGTPVNITLFEATPQKTNTLRDANGDIVTITYSVEFAGDFGFTLDSSAFNGIVLVDTAEFPAINIRLPDSIVTLNQAVAIKSTSNLGYIQVSGENGKEIDRDVNGIVIYNRVNYNQKGSAKFQYDGTRWWVVQRFGEAP